MATFNAIICWLQTYNGAISALAAVVVAAFTIVIAVVSGKQAGKLQKTIESNERIERPYLFVKGIKLERNKPGPINPMIGLSKSNGRTLGALPPESRIWN